MANDYQVPAGLIELRSERDRLMNEIKEKSKVFFHDKVGQLFAKFPELKAFSWTQYTPYFNDGEECNFGVNIDYPQLQWGDEEDLSEFYFSINKWDSNLRKSVPKSTEEYEADIPKNKASEAIKEFLGIFETEDFLFMFGDHVEVIVTAPGSIEVEDYNHE